MPIRLRNLEVSTEGMKRHSFVNIWDVTESRSNIIFAAPVACVVESITIFARNAMPPQAATASTTHFSMTFNIVGAGGVLVEQGASATALTSNAIVAGGGGAVYEKIVPVANNSLSTGQAIEFTWQQGGSCVACAVAFNITYVPLKRRETR